FPQLVSRISDSLYNALFNSYNDHENPMRDVNINEIIIMIKSSFEERNYREILLRAYSEIFSLLNSKLIDEMDRYIQYLDEELELLKKQEKDEKKTERIENKF